MSVDIPQLLTDGLKTAANRVRTRTQDSYTTYMNKFCTFCVNNGYPDPRETRHPDLPSLLVAYLQNVSQADDVSHNPAEKTRSGVSFYFADNANTNHVGAKAWLVEMRDGELRGFGNPTQAPVVQQFMRGLRKMKKTSYLPHHATPR
jgi:hypothetical protein